MFYIFLFVCLLERVIERELKVGHTHTSTFKYFRKKMVTILNENISHDRFAAYFVQHSRYWRLSMRMKCKRWKKIHPLATAGLGLPYRKFAGGVDLRRWSKRTLAQTPCLSLSLSPAEGEFAGLFTWINRSIKRVHTIPRRRRSATCINNFADTWRINRARAFPRNLLRHSSGNATWICYDASWPTRLYRSNYRAFFPGYLFATRYAGTIKLLVAGNMISCWLIRRRIYEQANSYLATGCTNKWSMKEREREKDITVIV